MKLLLLSKKIDSIKNILKPNSRIGFVGTAGEVYVNPIWINEDKIKLQEFGYKIIDIDITNNSIETTIKQLENIDCLYIAGGNVYYLKQQIENKKLEEAIKKFIFSDKLYVGSSAGSCICSPNLEIYKTLDDQQKAPNIKSLEGLNVIDFEIIPHYGRDKYADRHKEIIEKYKSKYKLLTLEDKESILFKSRDTYKLIE